MEKDPSEGSGGSSEEQEGQQQAHLAPLSKNQRKKLIKKEVWEKQKSARRQQKRQKQKQKKKEQRLKEGKHKTEQLLPDVKEEEGTMRKRREDYVDKMREGLPVVIDLQFWDLMTEKELSSLIRQLSHCHSLNRKSKKSFNYILTSATKERQKILSERYNADKWGITMHEQSVIDVFPVNKIVYLTGDAQEQIDKLDPELVYVIGGIVDHNRLKKITIDFAEKVKLQARRLPIGKVKLKASVHLAVNHVWEWMLKGHNGIDWEEALRSIIPQRKLEEINQQ